MDHGGKYRLRSSGLLYRNARGAELDRAVSLLSTVDFVAEADIVFGKAACLRRRWEGPNATVERQRHPGSPAGVLGTGRMGRAMAGLLARGGWSVAFGSSDPERGSAVAGDAPFAAEGGSYAQAARSAELVVLATAWPDTEAALAGAGPLEGRVLLDVTNPESEASPGLAVGLTTSGGEQVASWAPGARVVKAFNHVYAELVETGPLLGAERATVFICGDDDDAKALVAEIAGQAGFAPIDAGPLVVARYTEPAAQLMVQLVRYQGHPAADVALHLLRRAEAARG